MVKGRYVDPNSGNVLGEIDGQKYAMAEPIAPGKYRLHDIVFDTVTKTVEPSTRASVRVDRDHLYYQRGKQVLWQFPLGGGWYRHHSTPLTKRVVALGLDDDIIALDRTSGRVLWRKAAPNDRLVALGDRIIGLEGNAHLPSVPKRWLVAHDANAGNELYRIELPRKSDPESPIELGALLLVRNEHPQWTIAVRASGDVAYKVDERVNKGLPFGADVIVATEKRIARLDPKGTAIWEAGKFEDSFHTGAGFVVLDNADVLIFNYGAISDSGVELVRLSMGDGTVRWRRRAAPVGVSHSKYRHEAYVVRLPGDRLAVVSQGSYGSFLETIDDRTGAIKNRWTW